MKRPICPHEATREWLYLESIDYIAECLEACLDASMLADLREIFPRQALRVASSKVSLAQRQKITYWLQLLNEDDLAA